MKNVGGAACTLSNTGLAPDSDRWFSLAPGTPTTLVVKPGADIVVDVTFRPMQVPVPLERTGELVMDVNSPTEGDVAVPLKARVQSRCVLDVSPSAVNFGHVPIDDTATETVTIANRGDDPCEIRGIALSADTDSEFSLPASPPGVVTLASGEEHGVVVRFGATDPTAPYHRTGKLVFGSSDPRYASAAIPLSADVDIGCDLTWKPVSVDFGNVMLHTTTSAKVTLENKGTSTCLVSDLALGPGSDVNFALDGGQKKSFAVPPGGDGLVTITFNAADSAPPRRKTGTLTFDTGNARNPTGRIPLSAYVNSVCVQASQWIYTVDSAGILARFEPKARKFTDIAELHCKTLAAPFSMAVDQHATAWVLYDDGNVFKVDTSTGACSPTTFQVNQRGLRVFGMGFVFDPLTGEDTLYIAGGANVSDKESTLATIAFPSLVVTPIGPVSSGNPELTGTGDGELWGFIPQDASSSGAAVLVRLDPGSGKTLESHAYTMLTDSGAWAMKFWGGSFWIFLGSAVYEVQRDKPDMVYTVIANTGRAQIVGAGVSTCAPVQ